MRILENSQDRLRLFLGSWGPKATICTFDRRKNLAAITDLVFLIPIERRSVPMTAVVQALVLRQGSERRRIYYPSLEPRQGRSIRIARRTKAEAFKIAETIQDFLKFDLPPPDAPTP